MRDDARSGYHHLRDLYTADHWVKGKRIVKQRAPTRKDIPGLKAWLARHSAVLAPLLRPPPPRLEAAPKEWIPSALPMYPAQAVIRGRVAKTTRMETVYHEGCAVEVKTATKDTMQAEKLDVGAPRWSLPGDGPQGTPIPIGSAPPDGRTRRPAQTVVAAWRARAWGRNPHRRGPTGRGARCPAREMVAV